MTTASSSPCHRRVVPPPPLLVLLFLCRPPPPLLVLLLFYCSPPPSLLLWRRRQPAVHHHRPPLHGQPAGHHLPTTATTSLSLYNTSRYMTKEKGERREGDMEEVHGIVIVGGGICGLATALALHRKGLSSLVLEKSELLRAEGAAIGVHVNGWRALDQLGVAAELREKAILLTAFRDEWQQRNQTNIIPVRNELRCLQRRDLIETLANNLPVGTIRFGCHIVAIAADSVSNFAILTTVGGNTIKARVVIGCDGANSVVAKHLGLRAPSHLCRSIARGFTRYSDGHTFGNHFLRLRGKDFFVGRLPVNDSLVHFFVTRSNPSKGLPKEDAKLVKEFTLDALQEGPAEITEMVQHCDLESLNLTTKVWYRPPWQVIFGKFQKGTVTVAGDAMHVMGPYIGQGGSAGLEDAVVLARLLSQAAPSGLDGGGSDQEVSDEMSAAIGKYVKERRPRIAMLTAQSYLMGSLLTTTSFVKKLVCIGVLAHLFGGSSSLRHTEYDCGRL